MGLFGIGGSKSKSTSSSQAYSADQSTSAAVSRQGIAFEDLFQTLYGDAIGASGKVASNFDVFQGQAAQLFSGGLDFLSALGGNAGTDYLESRVTGDSGVLERQIGDLSTRLNKEFNRFVLPAIREEGIRTGTLGGGRQGIAEGIAAGDLFDSLTAGITGLMASDQAARDQAAGTLATDRISAAGVGLSGAPGVLGLAEAGATSDLIPATLLSQILGGPTTLTESTSYGQSSGYSSATSKSKSKSGSFDFGFGG